MRTYRYNELSNRILYNNMYYLIIRLKKLCITNQKKRLLMSSSFFYNTVVLRFELVDRWFWGSSFTV
jgi:hypothetical protein